MHVNLFIYSEKIPKQYFAKGFSLTILTIVYCMEHNITTMLPKDRSIFIFITDNPIKIRGCDRSSQSYYYLKPEQL